MEKAKKGRELKTRKILHGHGLGAGKNMKFS
jgi:hypothetical protein